MHLWFPMALKFWAMPILCLKLVVKCTQDARLNHVIVGDSPTTSQIKLHSSSYFCSWLNSPLHQYRWYDCNSWHFPVSLIIVLLCSWISQIKLCLRACWFRTPSSQTNKNRNYIICNYVCVYIYIYIYQYISIYRYYFPRKNHHINPPVLFRKKIRQKFSKNMKKFPANSPRNPSQLPAKA